ncbi:NAD(P)/FAD-dependent oxidoreductase [Candidatus Bathyarchaeota archaeon]|nr:MAG: NAD(P)/FAD-dependent oxidoreductase [Candidatus Bathyarchaeota archaeon]
MSFEERQILVVGAGPSGLIVAKEAARRGMDVLVVEEDSEIGVPCHCAGLLSLKGLERLNISTDGPYVQNMIQGAFFYSPSGLSFKVERQSPVACVVDRSIFDKHLASQAIRLGAEIKLNNRVLGIRLEKNYVVVKSENEILKASMIIDAEGVSSRIVKASGLKPMNPSHLLPGFQMDLYGVDVNPNYVEVHVGSKVAPGFFAWVIPLSSNSARVGLACRKANPKELLRRFVERRFKGEEYKLLTSRSGIIVTSGPIEKTFVNRLLIVGDAAGQVKPTTGGGVILGGLCGTIAGKIAAEAVNLRKFDENFLRLYEESWRRELGREFKYMLWARRILNALSDHMIDKGFELIIKEGLHETISYKGDMDFQSSVILELLRRRRILRMLIPLLRL